MRRAELRRAVGRLAVVMVISIASGAGGGLLGDGGATEAVTSLGEMVRAGKARLEEFDYSGALAAFDGVVQAFRQKSVDTQDREVRQLMMAALEGKAVANLGAGDEDAVAADFSEALSLDPSFQPDRREHSPKLLDLFEGVRQRLVGHLDIRTRPPGCDVWIDGMKLGTTPLEGVPWTAGRLALRLEKPGFDPDAQELELRAGTAVSIERQLTPNARTAVFLTSPPGATVFVDDVERGTSRGPAPAEIASRYQLAAWKLSGDTPVEHLSPGVHRVRFELPCHEPKSMEINIEVNFKDNRPVRYKPAILRRSTARLEVRSDPEGARVRVDSKDVGRTPGGSLRRCARRSSSTASSPVAEDRSRFARRPKLWSRRGSRG